jgi:Zn-dependent peptidase ImmA (M78 family)
LARPQRPTPATREADPLSLGDAAFKIFIVYTVLSKDTERAVSLVCEKYRVRAPKLRIGLPKGQQRALGVYQVEPNSIAFRSQNEFFDPFVVLHELYHCIRSSSGSHKGTEKNADAFAISYIQEYNRLAESLSARVRFPKERVD